MFFHVMWSKFENSKNIENFIERDFACLKVFHD